MRVQAGQSQWRQMSGVNKSEGRFDSIANVKICCFSFSSIILNKVSFGFSFCSLINKKLRGQVLQ